MANMLSANVGHNVVDSIDLMLARAEHLADEGDSAACLSVLKEICRNGQAIASEDVNRFEHIVLKLLSHAQSLLRNGDPHGSVSLLKELIRIAPENQELTIECLVISLYFYADHDLSTESAKNAEKRGFSDNRVYVLLSEFYCQNNKYEDAVRVFSRISSTVFPDRSYSDRKDLARGKISALVLQNLLQLRKATGSVFVDGSFSYIISSIADAFTDSNSFLTKVAFFSFYNEYGIESPYEVTADALLRIVDHVDTERRAVIWAYLYAINDRSRISDFLERFKDDADLWAHPFFARMVCSYARAIGDWTLESKALTRVLSGSADPSWTLINRKVQLLELRARAATLERLTAGAAEPKVMGKSRAPVVFVGVFGQLRHERDVLPALADYLRREEEALRAAFGARLHIGFSVWDSTGQRPVVDAGGNHGGLEVLYARLPADLVHILRAHGLHSLEAFSGAFPRVFDYAVACGREISCVDPELIKSLFPSTAAVDIAVKAEFAAEEEALMAASSRPGPRPADWRNQLRMWHRIGAFMPMIAALEESEGTPIAAGALVRADLLFHKGSLADLLRPVLEGRQQRSVCADYDPCAAYFEAVGDRYFAGDRDGILTVASCWETMKQRIAVCDGGGEEFERARRFGSHVFVGARLFEEAVQVLQIPRSQLEFEVCRGFLRVPDFRSMMIEDCENLANPLLRQQVMEFLRNA